MLRGLEIKMTKDRAAGEKEKEKTVSFQKNKKELSKDVTWKIVKNQRPLDHVQREIKQ